MVDNTFCSPVLQSPMLLGADLVINSCTKYLGGFSDIVAGAIVTDSDELNEKIRFNLMSMGGNLMPF